MNEPPHQEPTDRDFMEAHIAALEADNKEGDRLLLAAAVKYTGLEAKLSKMEDTVGTVDRTANSLSWSQLIDALVEAGYEWTPEVRQLENAIRALAAEALAGGNDE